MKIDKLFRYFYTVFMADTFKDIFERERRFHEPDDLEWLTFENRDGRPIRGAILMPPSKKPSAVVVCLQGLSEFIEKYYETARTLSDMNCAFAMIDWQGHGKSHRHLPNPHKKHSEGFTEDADDLHEFITNHVAAKPEFADIPLVMMAHSMGGNIGLRYMIDHPQTFKAAAFSAPLTATYILKAMPKVVRHFLSTHLKRFFNENYVPTGGSNWTASKREGIARATFSTDPVRNGVHNYWCKKDPALQVGNITNGWIYHALRSCDFLESNPGKIANLGIPFLVACAGKDVIVDNQVTKKIFEQVPTAKIIDLPDAAHEILMEQDQTRDVFFDEFRNMLKSNGIQMP